MIVLTINGQAGAPVYLGWSSRPASLKLSVAQPQATQVIIKTVSAPATGDVGFSVNRNSHPAATLAVTVPANGTSVNFFVSGTRASTENQDVTILVTDAGTGATLLQQTVMVRVRKNANGLSVAERNRFLAAIAKFNATTGTPRYQDFLDMHNAAANTEIHTSSATPRYSFLVWHRAFILDLERQLQKIDPSVSLPYWKFDEVADKVFTADFMGAAMASGTLVFNASNPLSHWAINGRTGIVRKPIFNVQTGSGLDPRIGMISEKATIGLGTTYKKFAPQAEQNPHGNAHESFSIGPITNITTATQDPIFYLLHANVDRLWALWQQVHNRYDITSVSTYPLKGAYPGQGRNHVGDFLQDTMWPWNGDTSHSGSTRPPTAPGGPFPALANLAPSVAPQVWQMIDYQGYAAADDASDVDYDSINFNLQNVTV